MSNLRRNLAPITQSAWDYIDEEVRSGLINRLRGRRYVDFIGPKGLEYAAVNTGRREKIGGGESGVTYAKRVVQPLVEVTVPFTIDTEELEALTRGSADIDSDDLDRAVEVFARAENNAIFNGLKEADIDGIFSRSDHEVRTVGENLTPVVADSVRALTEADVEGPYVLLLGPELYALLYNTDDRGYPVKRRLEEILGGEVVPVSDLGSRGLLLSLQGGDFEFISGQDVSVGYTGSDRETIEFFLTESFTFRVNSPEAAVVFEK